MREIVKAYFYYRSIGVPPSSAWFFAGVDVEIDEFCKTRS
jgi:hypothetical protein